MAEGDPSFRPVPFEMTDPTRIPAQRYYAQEFHDAEVEHMWPHVWQMACRTEQIPNVGDFIEYNNVGKSVIVVRTKDGIKAYHNACRHRGVPLAETGAHGNCKTQGFICPFHGWRWNMDGKNTFVYGRHMFGEEQLNEGDLRLPEAKVEEFVGCVFINHDLDAPSIRESYGAIVDGMEAYNADKMRAEWQFGTVLPANWKVAMEAFMEGYHVMRTHPQLQDAVPVLYNSMYGMDTGGIGQPINPNWTIQQNIDAQIRHLELLSEGMAGMCHAKDVETAYKLRNAPLPEDLQQAIQTWFGMLAHQVTEDGKARGEATPNLIEIAMNTPVNAVEFFFPHYFLLPFLSSMAAYRIRPLGPESCFFELWSLTLFPEGQEPAPVMEPTVIPYDSQDFPPIPRQDYSNIPIQQKGMHAKGFDYMRISPVIEGLISNFERILDGYLRGEPLDKLAAANTRLSGNFDGRILPLGLAGAEPTPEPEPEALAAE